MLILLIFSDMAVVALGFVLAISFAGCAPTFSALLVVAMTISLAFFIILTDLSVSLAFSYFAISGLVNVITVISSTAGVLGGFLVISVLFPALTVYAVGQLRTSATKIASLQVLLKFATLILLSSLNNSVISLVLGVITVNFIIFALETSSALVSLLVISGTQACVFLVIPADAMAIAFISAYFTFVVASIAVIEESGPLTRLVTFSVALGLPVGVVGILKFIVIVLNSVSALVVLVFPTILNTIIILALLFSTGKLRKPSNG